MKAILLSIVAVWGTLHAQTKITLTQVTLCKVTTIPAGSVLIVAQPPAGPQACYLLSGVTIQGSTLTIQPSWTAVDAETPAGTIDGNNATFTLTNTPIAGSVHVYRNGQRLTLGTDYTIASGSLTFSAGAVPQPGDILTADYRR